MGITEENTLRKFCLAFPNLENKIIEQRELNDFETMFIMSDGRRIIYEELFERYREINRDGKGEISKETWQYEFASRLKKKLIIKGLTQRDLADATGINEHTISRYMNGKSRPDGHAIQRICQYLKCPSSELIDFNYLL